MTELKQPQNYFTDIEQAALPPLIIVPGFAAFADPSMPGTPTNSFAWDILRLTYTSVLQT